MSYIIKNTLNRYLNIWGFIPIVPTVLLCLFFIMVSMYCWCDYILNIIVGIVIIIIALKQFEVFAKCFSKV